MAALLALVSRLTGLSPFLARLALAGGLAAAIVAGWGLHQWRAGVSVREAREAGEAAGKAAERAAWIEMRDEETRRRNAANAWARADGDTRIAALRAESDALADLVEELTHESLEADDRSRIALGADGVRRIAAVGRGGLCGPRAPAGRVGRADRPAGGAACRAMTEAEVEAAWIKDRRSLVVGASRHRALIGWITARDAALRGDPLRLAP